MSTPRISMKAREASASRATRAPAVLHIPRSDAAIERVLLRVEGEYRDMPGLSLTLRQAARLWRLDYGTCERVLTELIERRVLKRTLNGTYVPR